MYEFQFYMPTKVLFGAGQLNKLHTEKMPGKKALDKLIAEVGCENLKMSDYGITKEELKKYPQRVHEVLGGNIDADPVKLSDADYLKIFEAAYK